MTKKLFLLFILITLSGCNDPKPKDNTISKNTADIMLNREMVSTYQEPIKETILEEKNEEFRESKEKSEEETTKEEPNIPKETIIKKEEIDNNLNIHKGRIDCLDIDACIEISTKVQLSFNNLISDIKYLEVKNEDNLIKGYFIEYIFKDYKYETSEECQEHGKIIQETLNNRNLSFVCIDTTLKIIPDYKEE